MNKKAPLMIIVAILVAVVITVISIVVPVADKEKSVRPNAKYGKELSKENMAKIKSDYEREGVALEFESEYDKIELAVANKMLDGTVTSTSELENEITKINNMFKGDNWSYLHLEFPDYWMGTWSLDNTGKLYFTFDYEEIKPEWINTVKMKEYIK